MAKKLTADEDRVLVYLFENKDSGKVLSSDAVVQATGLSTKAAKSALRGLMEAGYIGRDSPDLLTRAMEVLLGMDPKFTPTARGYAEHIILIASAISKANAAFLAEELNYEPEFVGMVGSRLRNAGIWTGDELSPSRMTLWQENAVSFFIDGAVASGDLMVVSKIGEEPQYQMTPGGKHHVERLLGRQA